VRRRRRGGGSSCLAVGPAWPLETRSVPSRTLSKQERYAADESRNPIAAMRGRGASGHGPRETVGDHKTSCEGNSSVLNQLRSCGAPQLGVRRTTPAPAAVVHPHANSSGEAARSPRMNTHEPTRRERAGCATKAGSWPNRPAGAFPKKAGRLSTNMDALDPRATPSCLLAQFSAGRRVRRSSRTVADH